ncbi:nitrate- and nitrite sensing domain-containing protein [Streptomyces sp. NPDC059740]|uniref:nitrate- and nitrite sensing domain-containing protein n=1 Tax=Streptomyces sp. NPDC059740 TaxID=3346926 RepID=UPI0036583E4E
MQGRFKRDGSAAADPEPRVDGERAAAASHAQAADPADEQAPRAEGAATTAESPVGGKGETADTGSRMALRNWRISTRLVSLLALPVAAATVLGGQAIQRSVENIDQLDQMQLLTEMTRQATELAGALQTERDRSAGPLASGSYRADDANIVAPRKATDEARKQFESATEDFSTEGGDLTGVHATIVDIDRQLNNLTEIRNKAYQDGNNYSRTVTAYDQLVTSLLSLSQDMAQATSTPDMIRSTRALAAFSSAKEYASMQRAIITAGLAHKGGAHLSTNDRQQGQWALESEDSARKRFQDTYADRAEATKLTANLDDNTDISAAAGFSQRAFQSSSGITRGSMNYLDWYDLDDTKIQEMSRIEQSLLTDMEQKARQLRQEATEDGIINGALVLLVLGISLVGAFVVSRSMVRSLRRLQDTAQRVAKERLPQLVRQLSDADPHDVDTSVESVGLHSRDEIGKVASAFDDVHREAVRLASEQALLRGNVNAMFTNLSRRSQGLIQRQLSLISELESREADPDQLSSLFKLDHLATRMRRNGENLLVLAGEEPGRRWTRPVPLVDVLRAAASEVEQYERIELSAVPANEVAGRVVNDLVHLLAELLENATSFSSPQTKVKVTGHALPDGRILVEIHDTGIGLSPEDLAAINERLASPPTVDVSVSRRMGLFVVGRLSLRHGIRIQLRPSESGGTTALVMLPVEVAQGGRKPSGPPARPEGGGAPGGSGSRLAGLQPRGQVGGGRPALPARSGPGGAPRPPEPGPAQGPGEAAAFGAPSRNPRDDRGPSVAPPTGAPRREGQPQLPSRGTPAQLTGGPAYDAPGAEAAQPHASGQVNLFGGEGQGPVARPGTSWGARRERDDDWPLDSREGQDQPRGHDEREQTGSHARPAAGGPGDTAQFDRPDFDGPPPGSAPAQRGGPGDTAQFDRPDFDGPPPGTAPAPRSAGASRPGSGPYPAPDAYGAPAGSGYGSETGSHAVPQGYSERPGSPSDTGQYELPGYDTSWQGRQAGRSAAGGPPRETPPEPQTTGEYPRPGGQPSQLDRYQQSDRYEQSGRYEQPGVFEESGLGGQARPGRAPAEDADPFAGPAPASPEGGRTPIFDTVESHWFQQQAPDGSPEASGRLPRRAAGPRQDTPPAGGNPPAAGAAAPHATGRRDQAEQDPWRSSANDERWRKAEQVRQPAAGGVTTSGLPRRVPRANLVAGTAQAQPAPETSGPQVSRSPDEVRGRLTNLRRGIQQGRQAGTSATGNHGIVDPPYQQER